MSGVHPARAGGWRRGMAGAVGVGVGFSVLLVSVSSGVSYDIRHRLRVPGLVASRVVDTGRIDVILTELTVVVTAAMLVQTAVSTYAQGVSAMTARRPEIAIRRQSGVLRSTLVWEFARFALAACLMGGLAGEAGGAVVAAGLGRFTALPVRFGWVVLLGPFPIAVAVALVATLVPAWRAANTSPALLRRGGG